MTRKNHVKDEIEIGIHEAVERCQSQEPHGSLVLVFPNTSQRVVNELAENIAMLVEDEYNIEVFTDEEY